LLFVIYISDLPPTINTLSPFCLLQLKQATYLALLIFKLQGKVRRSHQLDWDIKCHGSNPRKVLCSWAGVTFFTDLTVSTCFGMLVYIDCILLIFVLDW